MKIEYSFPVGYNVSHDAQEFVRGLLRLQPSSRLNADQALNETRWLSPDAPRSSDALMAVDSKRPVKQLLREFNAQRMLTKVVKGAHRRLSNTTRLVTATPNAASHDESGQTNESCGAAAAAIAASANAPPSAPSSYRRRGSGGSSAALGATIAKLNKLEVAAQQEHTEQPSNTEPVQNNRPIESEHSPMMLLSMSFHVSDCQLHIVSCRCLFVK